MRTRFIHNDFDLDVSHLSLSWTEENSWFKEEFFLTSSFPFDIDFEENEYFESFQHLNNVTRPTYFQGKLEKDGVIEDAILEVEESDEKLRLTIRYGVEALPNWNKKLSELVLDVVLPDGGSMRLHANSIINQTYPAVNYNFPAIHTKFYDSDTGFELFQKVLNKRKPDGVFVQNWQDPLNEENPVGNLNIVYPFPYFIYVLTKAIEDAGYTLHGDILTDPDLVDAVIVPGKKITNFEGLPSPVEWIMTRDEILSPDDEHYQQAYGWPWQQWYTEQEFNVRGYFQYVGEINNETEYVEIRLNGNIIFTFVQGDPLNFNFFFSTQNETNLLTCYVRSIGIDNDASVAIWFMKITTLELRDENGNAIPQIANFSNVQLATMLPDMAVGDLVKFPKKLKNYDLDLRNNREIWMNLTQNEVIAASVEDISEYDIKRVPRKYEQAKSFLIQYEGEYDEKYKFDKIYADRTGYFINDYTRADNTTDISINGLPLPIDTFTFPGDNYSITTAVQLTDDSAKLQLVKYDGLLDGKNWTQEMTGLKPINLYLNFWQKWLNFIIHAIKFRWNIKDHPMLLMRIKKKSKLFSHNNYMFVFSLNRKRHKDIEEIEVEAYSSKV